MPSFFEINLMLLRKLIITLMIFMIIGVLIFNKREPVEVHLQGSTMGTTYNVKYSPLDTVDDKLMHQQIDEILVRVNKLMSTYDPNSELSRFNQFSSTEPFVLSTETLQVMQEAVRLAELTQGALDVTIGPVVNLWGFGPQKRPEVIPSETQIEQVLDRVGIDKLVLENGAARKLNPELYVDLSTIAKGYGVDAVVEALIEAGISSYLVEIGGEMRVAGNKLNGQKWRIAIEKPVTNERILQRVIEIGNMGIATSGDYRNYYEKDGIRYSHLIDPLNGLPIQHNLVSVTVVHPSTMTADGLATALMITGADEAKAIAEYNQLAVLLITKQDGQYVEWVSSHFEQSVTTIDPE